MYKAKNVWKLTMTVSDISYITNCKSHQSLLSKPIFSKQTTLFLIKFYCFKEISVRLRDVSVGLRDVSIGLRDVSIGLRDVSIGLRIVSIGLRIVSVGLRNVSIGLRNVLIRLVNGLIFQSTH